MSKLYWIFTILLGLVIAGLAIASFFPGDHVYIVRSDSMKPVFSAGDLIITTSPKFPIKVGAIITYQNGENLVTHRVVDITANGVITKGDDNNTPDNPMVLMSQIKGTYLMTIPFAGYVSSFMHTRIGWLLVVVLPAMLLLGWIVKDIIHEALQTT